MLSAGTLAPDFTLPADGGGEVTLSDYRGRPGIILLDETGRIIKVFPKVKPAGHSQAVLAVL